MNHKDKVELKKCRNVLIQSNDPRFNYAILKKDDIDDFDQCPQIVHLNRYDYSFRTSEGDDKELPKYIVAYRRNNNIVGYYVKNFPIARKNEKKEYASNKTFTSSKLSLDEKLNLAKKYLNYLKNKYNLPQ